jgi:RimJ/RimL family protein N-acetyltransferase
MIETAVAPPVLRGDAIRLRPVEERDLPHFVRWFNDPEVRYWLHMSERRQETLASQRERYERHRNDPARVEWCIETAGARPIGRLVLTGIDDTHGRAELYVSIGEKDCWNRGYGTAATCRALAYAFSELRLRRVCLTTDEDNVRGIRCYERCGFVREGVLRAYRLRHGEPVNRVIMGVLREDFQG